MRQVPVIFEDKFEALNRTQDVISALTTAGVYHDIERAKESKKGPRRKG